MSETLNYLHRLFVSFPLLALFITVALGYFIGKFKVKTFVLGGIAGSLIMGVIVGQLGIKMDSMIGSVFFALFIYAVGYQGGPQFFRSLNKKTLVQLISATITCVLGLLCVLIAAWVFHLDRGTAAGLAAGGLTQSAIIGSAGDAIAKLGLSPAVAQTLQSNVAVGYAVCYIFGSFGPILMLSTVFPCIMKWDLRKEAIKLAKNTEKGAGLLEAGQFFALPPVNTRVYQISEHSPLIGETIETIFHGNVDMAIESILRNGEMLPIHMDTKVEPKDIVTVSARKGRFLEAEKMFGSEIARPKEMQLIQERRKVILTNKKFDGKTVLECNKMIEKEKRYGVFLTSVSRMGSVLEPDSDLVLKRGDELRYIGTPAALDRLTKLLGVKLTAEALTDFIFFGLGMALGIVIGMISFKIFGVRITLGTGVGCLFSGLLFGWLKSSRPRFATFPAGASNFLRDFGLAAFVAVVGITAGPQAITTIKQYGIDLFLLGVGVTIVPQIITFYISYYILRIKNPIELLSTIAGGRSANPGFASLLEKAGNSTPVVPFTASYAIANIWLTLWGPIVIALVAKSVS